ncbi:unnamed protein product [Prorocentrum cordatum]|uniref:Uncharacterized protein n=1 Tax=Prorocentrum cordatum TaxID=2364126 RepID=A0ABN9U859_9DINO|nr:unnamed protein product [Polarella glacialis]
MVVTTKNAQVSLLVVRNAKEWSHEDADGGAGEPAMISAIDVVTHACTVYWCECRQVHDCRIGRKGELCKPSGAIPRSLGREDGLASVRMAQSAMEAMKTLFEGRGKKGHPITTLVEPFARQVSPLARQFSYAQCADKTQTVIISDWGDTLFPTTYVKRDLDLSPNHGLNDQAPNPLMKVRARTALAKAAGAADRCFYPGIGELIEKLNIQIAYARDGEHRDHSKVSEMAQNQFEKFWAETKGMAISEAPGEAASPAGGINKVPFKRALQNLASSKESERRLSQSKSGWAEQIGSSIRAMLRHVSTALCRPDEIPRWAEEFKGDDATDSQPCGHLGDDVPISPIAYPKVLDKGDTYFYGVAADMKVAWRKKRDGSDHREYSTAVTEELDDDKTVRVAEFGGAAKWAMPNSAMPPEAASEKQGAATMWSGQLRDDSSATVKLTWVTRTDEKWLAPWATRPKLRDQRQLQLLKYADAAAAEAFVKKLAMDFAAGKVDKAEMEALKKSWVENNGGASDGAARKRPAAKAKAGAKTKVQTTTGGDPKFEEKGGDDGESPADDDGEGDEGHRRHSDEAEDGDAGGVGAENMDDGHDDVETSVRQRPAAKKIIAAKRQKLQGAMKGDDKLEDTSLGEGKDKTSAKGVELNAQRPRVLARAGSEPIFGTTQPECPETPIKTARPKEEYFAKLIEDSIRSAPDMPDELDILGQFGGLLTSQPIAQFRQRAGVTEPPSKEKPPEVPTVGDDGTPLTEKDKKELEFWMKAAASNFEFAARGAAGNPAAGRWGRAPEASEQLEGRYEKATAGLEGKAPWAKQKEFMQTWRQEEYEKHMKRSSKPVSTKKTWAKTCKYLSIARMAWNEGGGKAGWLAASKRMTKCIAMGPPFLKYDGWSESLKGLFAEEEYSEEFDETWAQREEWLTKMTPEETAAAGTGALPAPAAAASAQPAPVAVLPAPAAAAVTPARETPAPRAATIGSSAASSGSDASGSSGAAGAAAVAARQPTAADKGIERSKPESSGDSDRIEAGAGKGKGACGKCSRGKNKNGNAETPRQKKTTNSIPTDLLTDAKASIAKYGLAMIAAHMTMNNITSGKAAWEFVKEEPSRYAKLQKALTSKLPDAKRVLGESKFNAALVAACGLKNAIETLAKEDKILNWGAQAREDADGDRLIAP